MREVLWVQALPILQKVIICTDELINKSFLKVQLNVMM